MSTEDAPLLRHRFENFNEKVVESENISGNLMRKYSHSRSRVRKKKIIRNFIVCLVNVSGKI